MKTLCSVQKGLNDYLETKRAIFPRFFFLSNDELLDILAETRDPKRVIPHLPKCFEGICDVTFDDDNRIIVMRSGEGECVTLVSPVDPSGGEEAGLVELWLLKLEGVMRGSLKTILKSAAVDYNSSPRVKFVLSWPAQIVLAVDGVVFTGLVEDALKQGTASAARGLAEVEAALTRDVADVVGLVQV